MFGDVGLFWLGALAAAFAATLAAAAFTAALAAAAFAAAALVAAFAAALAAAAEFAFALLRNKRLNPSVA
jgi:hypothetical protein